ncbi:MAG: type II toxin-antitoxin system RelE/ParE family toxin [Leptospiraceae bacterium]|nr:type II toxin-antitoxin system RelE/ParE family toxin [Leptospiraceae bacterium]
MREIEFKESVWKDLKNTPKSDIHKIKEKISSLQVEPNLNKLKLVNSEFYRIRQGDYRIFFEYFLDEDKITILRISHRKDAY